MPQPQLQPKKQARGRLYKYLLLIGLADVEIYLQYNASCQKELNRLLEKGVFEICSIDNIPKGVWLFNSHFIDKIKFPGTSKAFKKSQLVV
jgi:hypothetical protein